MSTPSYIVFQGHPEPKQLDILREAATSLSLSGTQDVRFVHTGGKFNTAERPSVSHLAGGLTDFKSSLQLLHVPYIRVNVPNVPGCTMDITNAAVARAKTILNAHYVRDLDSAERLRRALENVHTGDGYRVAKAKGLILCDNLPGLTAALRKAELRPEFKVFVRRVRCAIDDIKTLAAKPEFDDYKNLSTKAVEAWEDGVCEILGTTSVPYTEFLGQKAYGLFGAKKRDWGGLHSILKGTEHGILHFELFIKMLSIRGLGFVAVDIHDIGAATSNAALACHMDQKSSLEEKIRASVVGMRELCAGTSNVIDLQLGDGELDDVVSGVLAAGSGKCKQLVFVLPSPDRDTDYGIVTEYANTLCELFAALGQRFRCYFSDTACNLDGVKRAARVLCPR